MCGEGAVPKRVHRFGLDKPHLLDGKNQLVIPNWITPTCVGKTAKADARESARGDHPNFCREN